MSEADPLVVFILSQPGMVEALLDLHRDDGTGHCSICLIGGQRGRQTWPCGTSVAANVAATYRTGRGEVTSAPRGGPRAWINDPAPRGGT